MARWRNGRGTLVVGPAETGASGHGDPAAETAADTAEPWAGGPVTVPLEIAASYRARTHGLLGRDGIQGAILLSPANNVHTFRMRFPIDVAYLDRKLRVVAVRTMRPNRLGAIRLRARHVLESEAGTMADWGIRPGVRVAVREPDGRDA
ncbi:hypothetical protein GCM10018793_25230 [Streptomyces sulfonofaciens]|uniref:DUF192 domain-containing protein n=1 Tax=Streptomyces sulfonofaciens TaxID=68272 RepID=A0A919G455_9ACTN|nr:DUF192 domain-containing protein [Streptomyces sulfonofaciens]GHH77354.1 hypothetical protein GCM10018793_25230 [Streptomyces sulfonofaciens]